MESKKGGYFEDFGKELKKWNLHLEIVPGYRQLYC